MTLVILVWCVATVGASAIALAYDEAEGCETLGALVERVIGGVL